MLYKIKKLSIYVALAVALMMLTKNRYPSASFMTGGALLALTLQHL